MGCCAVLWAISIEGGHQSSSGRLIRKVHCILLLLRQSGRGPKAIICRISSHSNGVSMRSSLAGDVGIRLMVNLLFLAAVSIVERERQVLKSTGGTMPRSIVPRSASFCQHTFVHKLPVVMVVEDTFKDERWALPTSLCAVPAVPACNLSSSHAK